MYTLNKKNHQIMSSMLMDELFGELFAPISKFKQEAFGPATNVVDNEKELQMQIIMPGFSKENIKIEIDNKVLKISCEKSTQSQIDAESYLRREFELSGFSRSFTLPANVDQQSISSKLENGILSITLPKNKLEEPKTKTIEIQ